MENTENNTNRKGCWKKIHPKITKDEFGKAKAIPIISVKRPYMRSFHASWFGFFVAFTTWFGIQPLLPTIRKELGLSRLDLAHSGIAGVSATIAVRVIIGPLCDRFGPRSTMAGLLIFGSIPMAFVGLITNGPGLIITRLLISILGGTFVPCQFWTTAMFSGKVVGTANAFVGGWGNLGGGFTFIFMPAMFELVKLAGADEFLAWKIAACIPALICILTAIAILFTTDDCPQGRWKNRILPDAKKVRMECDVKPNEENITVKLMKEEMSAGHITSSVSGQNQDKTKDEQSLQLNGTITDNDTTNTKCRSCWTYLTIGILFVQYGCCFGVEIATNTVLNLYLLYQFKIEGCTEDVPIETSNYTVSAVNTVNITTQFEQTEIHTNKCSILNQNTASLIASLFGLMNIFARALGGVFSDCLRKYRGLPGRICCLFICLLAEGLALITFGNMETIPTAIFALIIFSLLVQMSEGATYAIVPYIMPRHVGVVAGIVGAGGSAGALLWNSIWTKLVDTDPSSWFIILGIVIICTSFLSFFTVVQGQRLWHVRRKSLSFKS